MQPFAPDHSTASASLSSQTVLVIDDVTINTDLIAYILRDLCTVRTANSGLEGLQLASTCLPSLILLDIWMPDMDGFEVCRHLKAAPRTRHIPVIFLTGKADVGHEELCLNIGATDFITKPFRAPVLLARVTNQLNQIQRWQGLEHYAHIDPLTGLGNHSMLELQIGRECLRLQAQTQPLMLWMAQIDGLTAYLAEHGSGAADSWLLQLSRTLQTQLQRPGEILTRYSDALFIALIPDAQMLDSTPLSLALDAALDAIPVPEGLALRHSLLTYTPTRESRPQHLLQAALAQLEATADRRRPARSQGCGS